MRGHVEVNNSARSVLHYHQHVKQPESRARDDAEVTGDDGRRVILQKGGPALVVAPVAAWCGWRLWQVLADRARRDAQAEFQQQFVCNAPLTPRATVLEVKPLDALPTGFTGFGITGNIPPVNLWATLPPLCGDRADSSACDV